MRSEYRKLAEENTLDSQKLLGEFYEGGWKLAQTSSRIIDKCLMIDEIANDIKKTLLLIMLRNCVSDLCSYLDSLERGHQRPVLNNLRMTFEDFCCAVHINSDETTYNKFLNSKHRASHSIDSAKKLRPNDEKFKFLYGELSKISHHVAIELIARQMISRDGLLSHLKPINPKKLYIQTTPLLIIIDFLRSIGEFSEEVCLLSIPNPYFWVNSTTRNLETEEDKVIQKLIQKTQMILKG